MWNGKQSVLRSWESWAGACWGTLEQVCRDGVFLVGSGQEQSRIWVLHSPHLGKNSEPVAQGGKKGWGLQLHPVLTELLYIP